MRFQMRVHVEAVELMGTADALRKIKHLLTVRRIDVDRTCKKGWGGDGGGEQKDFFVLSCDIVTDVFIHYLADTHRAHDASVVRAFALQMDEK